MSPWQIQNLITGLSYITISSWMVCLSPVAIKELDVRRLPFSIFTLFIVFIFLCGLHHLNLATDTHNSYIMWGMAGISLITACVCLLGTSGVIKTLQLLGNIEDSARLYELWKKYSPLGWAIFDKVEYKEREDLRILDISDYGNDNILKMVGESGWKTCKGEIVSQILPGHLDPMPEEDNKSLLDQYLKVIETGEVRVGEIFYSPFKAYYSQTCVKTSDSQMLLFWTELTFTRHLQLSLQGIIKRLPSNVAIAVCQGDDMRYLYYSDSLIEMYNLEHKDYTGKSHYEVFPSIVEEHPDWIEHYKSTLDTGSSEIQNTPVWFTKPNGERQAIVWGTSAVRDSMRSDDYLAILVWLDVTEIAAVSELNQQLSEELKNLAFYDQLTGLANRSYFEKLVDLAYASRENTYLTVLLLDLDGFKLVNDSFGHNIGDKALVEFVDRINPILRKSEVFCRWGGDEFAILLTNQTEEDAVGLAQRISSVMEEGFVVDIYEFNMGVSIGISGESLDYETHKAS